MTELAENPQDSGLVAGRRRRAGPGGRLQMGGLVKLEPKVERDGFSVAWALPPDLA